MVNPIDAPLNVAPHPLDVIRVSPTGDVLLGFVLDSGMEVAHPSEPMVAHQFVGVDDLPLGDVVLNHGEQGMSLYVGDYLEDGPAIPLHHTGNDSLPESPAPARSRPLASDVCLIDFDFPKELEVGLSHELPDLVKHPPSRFVGDSYLPFKLFSGYSRPGGSHEEHGVEPGAQWGGRLVEDGIGGRGDVRAADLTTIDLAAPNAMVGSDALASEAVDTMRPSGILDKL